ncbi:MAG TPA: DUF1385 domain-containing protein [Bacillota bacterium]|jgi:uncharacterized protein YqhQ
MPDRSSPSKEFNYGGQAVIEGVMMRGRDVMATAVRRADGSIICQVDPAVPASRRYKWLGWPVIRGAVALYDSVSLGLKALVFSSNQMAEGEGEKVTAAEMSLTMLIGVAVAIALFVVAPTLAIGLVKRYLSGQPIVLNLVEGVLRLAIFLGYLAAITRLADIQRVFAYHGAEHKVILAYEACPDQEVTVEATHAKTTLHPRCGTSFLLFVVVVSIILFSFFGWPGVWQRIATRLALLPVVAGLSYEIIRLSGRSKSPLIAWAVAPGLWLQRLTTRQPDDSQVEVAIAALKGARTGVGFEIPAPAAEPILPAAANVQGV